MKIESVICQVLRVPSVEKKTASSQDVVLVRVVTSDGIEGIGEADASPEVVKAIVDAPFSHNIACGLRQILLGENPLETERLWQKMYRRTQYFGRSSVTIAAMSAVDMALWDIKGKVFGQPIHRLLVVGLDLGAVVMGGRVLDPSTALNDLAKARGQVLDNARDVGQGPIRLGKREVLLAGLGTRCHDGGSVLTVGSTHGLLL